MVLAFGKSFACHILVLLFITLLQICMMLHTRRIESSLSYRVEIINETLLVILYYVAMSYGVFIGHGTVLHDIGSLHIALIFTIILPNAAIIAYLTVKWIIKWYKYRLVKKPFMVKLISKLTKKRKDKPVKTEARD